MVLGMTDDHFGKGLAIIRSAVESGLRDRGVMGYAVNFTLQGSDRKDAVFSVSANGKMESQRFTRAEIEDSGTAINAPAAHKVRLLYAPFVT
jgi:hypothetical protein